MRNSFYDALMVFCIPVMSESDFAKFCPYNDVITYSNFVDVAVPAEMGNTINYLNSTFSEKRAITRLQTLHQVIGQLS